MPSQISAKEVSRYPAVVGNDSWKRKPITCTFQFGYHILLRIIISLAYVAASRLDDCSQTPGKSHKGAFAALATVAEASEAQHVERAVAPVNVDGDARSE